MTSHCSLTCLRAGRHPGLSEFLAREARVYLKVEGAERLTARIALRPLKEREPSDVSALSSHVPLSPITGGESSR